MSEKKQVILRSDGKIFSGPYSKDMWDEINNARTVSELRLALYGVCCRIQELESIVVKKKNRRTP